MYNMNRYVQHREFALSCTCNVLKHYHEPDFQEALRQVALFSYKVGTQKSKRILQ